MINDRLRQLPKMDFLMEQIPATYHALFDTHWIKEVCSETLEHMRHHILNGSSINTDMEQIVTHACKRLDALIQPSLKPVINATGIVLHTNLGRSVVSNELFTRISDTLTQYNTLEYNITDGTRGSRYTHIEEKLCRLTGAEAALVVNNNASAVMLVLNTMAQNQSVVVSRGELVEIGGSFRVPDVMKLSGCQLIEVGTTNKTHEKDYVNACSEDVALLLKIHTSNFKIVGFTKAVTSEELVHIGRSQDIPVYEDLGSGLLMNLDAYGLEKEPLIQDTIKSGVDIVSFSGDKLFGGAQCGIIVGKKKFIDLMKKNQLLRAFRIDKFSLAVIEHSLIEYFKKSNAQKHITTLNTLTKSEHDILSDVKAFVSLFGESLSELNCRYHICEMTSEVGGGAMPLQQQPSFGLELNPPISPSKCHERLRHFRTPVIATIENDALIFNFRTIFSHQYHELYHAMKYALEGERNA